MSESNTPRVDSAEFWAHQDPDGFSGNCVTADFARQLEREVAELKAKLDAAKTTTAAVIAAPQSDIGAQIEAGGYSRQD